ncbi:MAG: hypothetical protein ABIJ50_00970 [Pseudomonadota bacterium]
MAVLEEHCQQAITKFGNPYEAVHRWLDEFAGKPGYGMRHRRVRHHLAGIQQVWEMLGEEAACAARQHIMTDLKEEGWTEHDPFPTDEQDYIKIGFF